MKFSPHSFLSRFDHSSLEKCVFYVSLSVHVSRCRSPTTPQAIESPYNVVAQNRYRKPGPGRALRDALKCLAGINNEAD